MIVVIANYALGYNVLFAQQWTTFERQPLLFARHSPLQVGMWLRPQDKPGRRSQRRLAFSRHSRAVVSGGEGTNGYELSKTSSQRESTSGARVARDRQGSTELYLGAYIGFADRMLFLLAQARPITVRHEIINTGAELIDIDRVLRMTHQRAALGAGLPAKRPCVAQGARSRDRPCPTLPGKGTMLK
jgi:hypothetical protein